MTTPDPTQDRLIRLELAVAHLQHDFEQLHQVALALQAELRTMSLALSRFDRRLMQLGDIPEERSPELERPPHY